MPAIVRGRPRQAAGSRPQAAKSTSKAAPRPAAKAVRERAPYAPAKINAAAGVGLKPGIALGICGGVMVLGLLIALFTGDRLQRLGATIGHGLDLQMAQAGFRLAAVHVEGATPDAQADILKASGLYRDQPILGLNLDQVRGRIQHVGWVKDVRVVRLLPDTLVISISQRTTSAVWQTGGRTFVVDDHGQVIPEANAGSFSSLPLIVGDGANETLGSILPLVRARPELMQRLEALVRVDDRRWDIRLKDGGIIQLPADGEESALIQFDALEQKSRILELGFERIDLRDPELVAVRPLGAPPAEVQPVSAGV